MTSPVPAAQLAPFAICIVSLGTVALQAKPARETCVAMAESAEFDLTDVPLFAHLSEAERRSLRSSLTLIAFEPGQTVIEEGTIGASTVYIVVDGTASLRKKGRSLTEGVVFDYEIAVRGPNQIFGEMPLLDGEPISVTAIAKTPLTVAILNLDPHGPSAPTKKVRNAINAELRRYASSRLRRFLDDKVETLRIEAEVERYRNAVSSILVTTLCLLSVYTLLLSTIPAFESLVMVNFAASPFVITLFAASFIPVILRSGFPLAFFGIQTANLRSAIPFTLLASAGFLVAVVIVKAVLIATLPSLSGMTVISLADIQVSGMHAMQSALFWIAAGVYLLLTPVQEFVARCGIQAPLYAFLQGSEIKRRLLSIAISNLVFSAAHAHISLQFALAAFIPGIFWGWIFARTNSLLAASLSHFMIGGAGVFLFGIEEFVARLM